MKASCDIALKEWAVVVRALSEGRQCLLFRKGGIREEGKDFRVEEDEFFFFPTFEHQHPEGLREEFRPWLSGLPGRTPETLSVDCYATVAKVLHLRGPEAVHSLSPYHIYSEKQILERFQYKPDKPLYLLLLRVFKLPPVLLRNLPVYAGCKSWVKLESPLLTQKASPVLPDDVFARKAEEIGRLTEAGTPADRQRGG